MAGVGWTSFIQVYRIGVGILTTGVLVYLLDSDAFGLVAGAGAVVGVLMLLKDLGTGAAIVQRRDLDARALASVFWANVILGGIGTGALIGLAPWIAAGLDNPELTPLIRALAWMVLLAAIGTTHQSLLQRDLRFARLARIEATALTGGALVGIGSAFLGAGAWALVLQSLVTTGIATGMVVWIQGFRPGWTLHLPDLRGVAKFSLNLTGFNLLNYLVRSADQLLILRFLGQAEAGLYYVGVKILLFPLSTINAVFSRVLFPLFAKIQDDDARLRNAFLKVTSTIALIVVPCLFGFAALAEPIIDCLLPPKWLPLVPITTALVCVAFVHSMTTSVGNLYLAKARTDLMLAWGCGAGVVYVTAFVLGLQAGVVGVARAYAAAGLLLLLPAVIIPLRLIRTPLRDFVAAVWRPILAAGLMAGVVVGCGALFPLSPWVDLCVRIPVGVATYVAFTLWLNRRHLEQVLTLIRTRGVEVA